MQIPYLDRVTPPEVEPFTLAEVKLILQVDGSGEDAYLVALIKRARVAAEEYLRRSLITQTWQLQFDSYSPMIVNLPKGPVQDIIVVKIIAQDWSEKIISSETYYLDSDNDQLIFKAAPIGLIIQVRYRTGYGEPFQIPLPIVQGMLAHITSMYEKRDADYGLPKLAADNYAQYKKVAA